MSPAIGREGKHLYEFGRFRLDPGERVLVRDGQRVTLAPKAFDTLFILVQHSGHALTKDELIKSLWPDSFVEENNLTQQISQLRRVLGEGTDGLIYIETVPKLGYRFVPEVREIVDGNGELVRSRRTRTHIVLREEVHEEDDEPSEGSISSRGTQELSAITTEALVAAKTSRATQLTPRASKWILVLTAAILIATTGLMLRRALRPSGNPDHAATAVPIPAIPPVKPRYSVLVLGFKNLSGRPASDWLSPALAEMLTTELAAGGQLRVVPGEEVERIKSDLKLAAGQSLGRPTLAQIRNRVGAEMVVSGSSTEVGSGPHTQLRLDLQLQDSATGEVVFSTAVTGRVEELFSLVSQSGATLRARLGAPALSDTEGAQAQAALPSTPEAARFYSQGVSRLWMFDAPEAERLLSHAVAVDPNFALGHIALASAWSALGYDERAKAEARRAFDLSLNLSRHEHLLIAGQYSELSRNWDQAIASYRELVTLSPDNSDYRLRLAGAQTSAGKGQEALATLETLRSLPPPLSQDPRIDLAEADAESSLGDFMHELNSANRAALSGTELGAHLLVARAWTKKSWALRRLGQPDESIAGLREAKKTFAEAGDMQGVGSAMRLIGGVQQERGDFSEAEPSFKEAIAIFRRIGDRRELAMSINGLAISHYERNDLRTARLLDQQYLEIEEEVGSKINTAGALGNIANVEEAEGNLAEAARLNEESIKIFTEVGDQRALGTALGNLAILLYEQGELESAKAKFNDALAIKRKIGYQRGIAYDLSGLSQVLGAEGNLDAARRSQEEALKIRNQIGEQHNSAVSRLGLAVLDLEDQKPADAEKIARETAEEFNREKLTIDEATAEEVAARSLLAQGKIPEARAAIQRARTLGKGAPNLPLGFDISDTSARIGVAQKNPPNHADSANARRELESALAVARRCGYLGYVYKLGLALGEIEVQSGNTHQGRARLEALADNAKAKGFSTIARDATAALKR